MNILGKIRELRKEVGSIPIYRELVDMLNKFEDLVNIDKSSRDFIDRYYLFNVWFDACGDPHVINKPDDLAVIYCPYCDYEFEVEATIPALPVHFEDHITKSICEYRGLPKPQLPLRKVLTVKYLKELLNEYDDNLPVMVKSNGTRYDEYFSVLPTIGNLSNQETGGDPEYHGRQKLVLLS